MAISQLVSVPDHARRFGGHLLAGRDGLAERRLGLRRVGRSSKKSAQARLALTSPSRYSGTEGDSAASFSSSAMRTAE